MKLELPKGFSVRTLQIESEHAQYVITRINLPNIGDGFLLAARTDFGTTRFRSIDAGRRVDGEAEPRFESIEAALEAVKEDAASLLNAVAKPFERDNAGHDILLCDCLDCENERRALRSHEETT